MAERRDELSATGVVVRHGYVPVLDGLDLTIREGDPPTGLVGESATGKTTLARTLLGVLKPVAGSVTFDGRRLGRMGRREKRVMQAAVGSVRQNGLVSVKDERRSAAELLVAAFTRARRAGRETGLDPEAMLALVELEPDVAVRPPVQLSGGQRQRLALATALATRPSILILDEPVTAIDEHARRSVMGKVAAFAAEHGTGMLLISHDLPMLSQVTERVHVLAEGRIVESGPLRDLMTSPQHEVTRGLSAALPQAYLTAGALR
ncbi:MAG: ATP-binding cassette domain-containing protein [Cellulomonadaceae bacterium]